MKPWHSKDAACRSRSSCQGYSSHGSYVSSNHKNQRQHERYIDQPLPASQADAAAADLISSMDTPMDGLQLRHLSSFMRLVPAMIQSSQALLAAVACCLDARRHILTMPPSSLKADPKKYTAAIHALQVAINDPGEAQQIPTLVATFIIHRVEVSVPPLAWPISFCLRGCLDCTCYQTQAGQNRAHLVRACGRHECTTPAIWTF